MVVVHFLFDCFSVVCVLLLKDGWLVIVIGILDE